MTDSTVFTIGLQINAAFLAVQPLFDEKTVCGAHLHIVNSTPVPYAIGYEPFSVFLVFFIFLPLPAALRVRRRVT
ncbi:MAG: hypothetical protein KDI61_01480, partial [Alphaproteobacteria bacterium]|nr:hypothetical protein [Alphaproteobacteria bacterium]